MTERIIRRTRAVARGALRQENTVLADINERMQSIAQKRLEMVSALEEIDTMEREVESLMKSAKMNEHEAFGLLAQFVEVKTNDSREITVEELRKAMKNDKEFFACLKVQLTPLKQFFTELEIRNLGTFHPGKVTGTKFQIIQPKAKVGKGGKK